MNENILYDESEWLVDDELEGYSEDPPFGDSKPELSGEKVPSNLLSREHSVPRRSRMNNKYTVINKRDRGYPYVILNPANSGLHPDDRFTLESLNGEYSETVAVSQGRRYETGSIVLWFPIPPAEERYNLRYDPAKENQYAESYYVFNDEPASYISLEDESGDKEDVP